MEIKINKEIRAYHESVFFGLSLRQFLCSALAVGTAVGVYLIFKDVLGKETVSWLCIVAAVPVAAAGFFQYNGLNLEQFLIAFVKSELLCAGRRVYKSENIYRKLLAKKGVKHRD